MQQPHLNIIWWQLIVFVNILQIFLVPRYDEHLITCSILLFLFRYFQSSLVGRFLLGSYISDCMPVYILIVLVISDLFLMQAGRRKKEKSLKSKNPKKIQNPKSKNYTLVYIYKRQSVRPKSKSKIIIFVRCKTLKF